MFFISLRKLFSFSRKSNFSILDIQISWHHQMPKHKTRNTFYWIIWEVNTICLCHITEDFIKKFCKNCDLKTSSRPFCVWKEWSTTSTTKWNFCSKLCIRYKYQQNYQNLSISAHWPPQIPLYWGFLEN